MSIMALKSVTLLITLAIGILLVKDYQAHFLNN